MKMNRLSPVSKGNAGEAFAVKYLKKHKYRILERNLRNRYSEIDIIADNDKYIVFVEVKSRSQAAVSSPCEAVTREKQTKLICAASDYMLSHKISKQPRFDIAEVTLTDGDKAHAINYIENAFSQRGTYAIF